MRLFRILICIYLVSLTPSFVFADDAMKSRFGKITVTKVVEGDDPEAMLASRKFFIKLNDKILYQAEFEGMSSVAVEKMFHVKDKDVLLVSTWDGGNINPVVYNFISINSVGSKKSKDFYGPDPTVIKVKQISDKLEVKYPYSGSKGLNYELTRPPIIYENDEIKAKGKKR
jgi:hypothetical protein